MATKSNNQVLLTELIKQEFNENKEFNSIDTFFEFYSTMQIMKDAELSDEEIISGLKGAGADGGCDSIYIFLNNILIDEDNIDSFSAIKDATISLNIIQAKNTSSFKEDVIMKWKTTADNLLNFDNEISKFDKRYNKEVLMSFDLFKKLLIKLVRNKYKTIIKFTYVSLADDLHPNVEAQANELKDLIKKLFPNDNTKVIVEFVGSHKFMEKIQQSPQQEFLLPLVENPISIGHQKDYIALVKLSDYYRFITDENGSIRNNIFESNVRDYQGSNIVNSSIRETLDSDSSENFWWLNNGITIIAHDATQPTGKEIVITSPEIVNGLQTSNEIYNFFSEKTNQLDKDTRSVLIRIVVPTDSSSRDRIISATNNQTSIPKSSLRVTDQIHWQIEMYLKNKGLFYDRRKNYYKNQGRKSHEIISVSFLAQCLITLLLQQPDQARSRPSTLLTNDSTYKRLYESGYNLDLYWNCASIGKKIDKYVKSISELTPPVKSDILFYVLYTTVATKINSTDIDSTHLTNLSAEDISIDDIKSAVELSLKHYVHLGGNGRVAKGQELISAINDSIFPKEVVL